MTDPASVHIVVSGRVQGVYFRDFALRHARQLGLSGYVRNLPAGSAVEVRAEGERSDLERLIGHLKVGPSAAKVEDVVINWSAYTGSYSSFGVSY